MALLENEAQRLADSLKGYEHVEPREVRGDDEHGYGLVVEDHRFDVRYEINSHSDFWDFVAAVEDHTQFKARPLREEVA